MHEEIVVKRLLVIVTVVFAATLQPANQLLFVAAVALYVAHYNLCRTHEALRTTPVKAIGVADRA
jgi:hypothetical protein